ncbi:TPA: reverse transcriptase domain-containing protein, partial [Serratia fonticola]
MKRWSPQRYQTEAKKRGISPTTIKNTLMHAKNIIAYCPGVYPIFTLRHLSYMAGVEYSFLRRIISREHEAPYREFYIRKKSSNSKRRICVPTSQLLKVQRFIHDNILKNLQVHSSSYAYSTESSIMDAATKHIESRWLIKLDVENFFESISEISVYRLFRDHGFPSLFSFELARICTRVGPRS